MSELFDYLDRLRDVREFLDDLKVKFPGVHTEFLADIVPNHSEPGSSTEQLTVAEKIAGVLDGNPWQTAIQIAEQIDVKKSIVSSTMYAKGSRGKFTSKTDPDNPRGKVWAIAQPDEVCLVGSKKVKAADKRARILDLIREWLLQQHEGSINDIAAGIEPFIETTATDFKSVVRTVANRATGDGILVVRTSKDGNVYALSSSQLADDFSDFRKGGPLLHRIRQVFKSNGNEPLTVVDLEELVGAPQSSIQDLIYTKHPLMFDRLPSASPGKQARVRIKGDA